jgi:hypothetical protein
MDEYGRRAPASTPVATASRTDIREVTPVHRLSVIVPFVGDLKRLEDTLVSVLQHRPSGVEVIVPHSVPYGDPYHLAGEVRFLGAPKRSTAVQCAALGIAASDAPVVHLLGCGTEVSDGWIDAPLAHFARPDVAAVSPLLTDRDRPECVLATGVAYFGNGQGTMQGAGSTRFTLPEDASRIMGPTLRAAFYRKAAIDALPGGLDPALGDELSAVDVAATLKRVGWSAVFESRSVVYDDAPQPKSGRSMRSAFHRGLHEERLFRRQLAGRLTRATRAGHGMSVLSNLVMESPLRSVARVVGHLCGAAEAADYDRFHERLIHVERAVAEQLAAQRAPGRRFAA